jgi:hypothetical protein
LLFPDLNKKRLTNPKGQGKRLVGINRIADADVADFIGISADPLDYSSDSDWPHRFNRTDKSLAHGECGVTANGDLNRRI